MTGPDDDQDRAERVAKDRAQARDSVLSMAGQLGVMAATLGIARARMDDFQRLPPPPKPKRDRSKAKAARKQSMKARKK